MNNEQIKQLEKELWDAADALRANSKLTAGEYKDPILGLVFLRFAQNLYEQKKVEIEANIPEGPRGKRALTSNAIPFALSHLIMRGKQINLSRKYLVPQIPSIMGQMNN